MLKVIRASYAARETNIFKQNELHSPHGWARTKATAGIYRRFCYIIVPVTGALQQI